jgi:hypothetical protein
MATDDDTLTVEKILATRQLVPNFPTDSRPVCDSSGRVVCHIAVGSIVKAVLEGAIEWDAGSLAFYLTPRCERALDSHKSTRGDEP